jgi:hypothetical protein
MKFAFKYTRRDIPRTIVLEADNVADATSLGYIRAGSVIDNVRCEPATSYEALEALVAQAKDAHPDLGLSFGYIGNLERWGDDRDWRIFTNRMLGGRSYSLPLGSTDNLDRALEAMPEVLPRFLAVAAKADRRH